MSTGLSVACRATNVAWSNGFVSAAKTLEVSAINSSNDRIPVFMRNLQWFWRIKDNFQPGPRLTFLNLRHPYSPCFATQATVLDHASPRAGSPRSWNNRLVYLAIVSSVANPRSGQAYKQRTGISHVHSGLSQSSTQA